MQRVHREQGRDESTRPERRGHLQQHQEQGPCGHRVQEDVRQVMSTRIRHTVQLDVRHV
jgi:hypothetical protein